MLKKLSLFLCVTLLILLAACKQDKAPGDNTGSTPSDVQSNSQNTTSGIELEEDVFDDSDITSAPSKNNSSAGNSTSSSDESVSDDNTPDNTSSDENLDQEDSNQSKDEVVVDDDGTIKLPIDKFN